MSVRESRPTQADETALEAFTGAEDEGTNFDGTVQYFEELPLAERAEESEASVAAEQQLEKRAETALTLVCEAQDQRMHIRIAHYVAEENLHELIHVSGVGWHVWDGRRWAPDPDGKAARHRAMRTIQGKWREVKALREKAKRLSKEEAVPVRDAAEALSHDLEKSSTASGVSGVLQLTAALPGISVPVEELDADPYALNLANGTLDLRTLTLRPHDPSDHITKITRADYRPDASAPAWEKFLEQVLPDAEVRGYFQRFCGLSLIGKVLEHIFTIATGSGRNGKGVAYQALLHTLGDYAAVADPALMEVVRANPNAPSPAFFDLRGRRMVVLSETDTGIRISAAILKRLTGGDVIRARALHQAPVEFTPSHTFLMVTNHLPELPSKAADPAVWARLRVVPFDVVISAEDQDPRLGEKLEQETDGIMGWMVEGLRAYQADGLSEPSAVESRTEAYADDQDVVAKFIDTECAIDCLGPNDGSTTQVLHERYKEYCAAEGVYKRDQLGRQKFAAALEAMGFPSTKTRNGMTHFGLVVREAAPPLPGTASAPMTIATIPPPASAVANHPEEDERDRRDAVVQNAAAMARALDAALPGTHHIRVRAGDVTVLVGADGNPCQHPTTYPLPDDFTSPPGIPWVVEPPTAQESIDVLAAADLLPVPAA